jgi:hypothetical protein
VSTQREPIAVVKAIAALLRDTVSFLLGWALMLKQAGIFFEPPEKFEFWVLAVGALVAGVPGFAQVLAWRFGATGGSPSAPPQPPAPLPEASSSST